MIGPWLIRKLAELRVGQPIREIGPDHQSKEGTPTMGGLLILFSILVSVLLWSELDNRMVWILLSLTFGYAILGYDTVMSNGIQRRKRALRRWISVRHVVCVEQRVLEGVLSQPEGGKRQRRC